MRQWNDLMGHGLAFRAGGKVYILRAALAGP